MISQLSNILDKANAAANFSTGYTARDINVVMYIKCMVIGLLHLFLSPDMSSLKSGDIDTIITGNQLTPGYRLVKAS